MIRFQTKAHNHPRRKSDDKGQNKIPQKLFNVHCAPPQNWPQQRGWPPPTRNRPSLSRNRNNCSVGRPYSSTSQVCHLLRQLPHPYSLVGLHHVLGGKVRNSFPFLFLGGQGNVPARQNPRQPAIQ